MIEVVFRASKYSSWLAVLAWVATTAGFFVFDDWDRNWYVFLPLIVSVCTGFIVVILALLFFAPIRYGQISPMAEKMEYRFYRDNFVYTVGDGKWRRVGYEKLKEIELRKAKGDMGHLRLHFDTTEKINFASRKIPNIRQAESARNDVQRIVTQYQERSRSTSDKA